MFKIVSYLLLFTLTISGLQCQKKHPPVAQPKSKSAHTEAHLSENNDGIITGAEQLTTYLPLLQNKKVGLLVNQTSVAGKTHLVDTLLARGVDVRVIFAPEHGFRGHADAGATIKDGKDEKSGVAIISLYGSKKGPSSSDLAALDIVIFDLQDVGVRFYTYLSSLKYLMEACADNDKPLIILDRPNPNGHYIDGPVLKPGFESFVGVIPIPIVHGMTLGELGNMMNGESWLKNGVKCTLYIIPCKNYKHSDRYILPIKPSPNLPNERSVLLYPSVCLLESTVFSVGRGTDQQFQVYGAPKSGAGDYYFTPIPKPGAIEVPHKGQRCRGFDLTGLEETDIRSWKKINLSYLLDAYHKYPDKPNFFLKDKGFERLLGNDVTRKEIIAGKNEREIRAGWQIELEDFRALRNNYLLYPE